MKDWVVVSTVVLIIAAAWATIQRIGTSYRFRQLIRRRGISTNEIDSSGTLILDFVYGASLGIGSPIVWYNPPLDPTEACSDMITDRTRIVDIEPTTRSFETLRTQFPGVRIIESTTL